MFNSLTGIITGKFPKQVFIDTNGVEWDLCVPDSNLDMLPPVGNEAKVYTWPSGRPLADFLPTISIKAKDFAAEMTSVNVQAKDLYGESAITREHVDNNAAVRKMLTERGIIPENLPAAEDVKKVERRLTSEEKKLLKNRK